MFHFTPAPLTGDFTNIPAISPRDKYLAAIAQAKAEYDAANAAQRIEEESLRLRLQELKLHQIHQEQGHILGSQYGRPSYYPSAQPSTLDPYAFHGYDALSDLRRKVEEEEHLRTVALLRAEDARLREQAEAARIAALKRKEEEDLLRALARRRAEEAIRQQQAEEARFAALKRQQEEAALRLRQRRHISPGPERRIESAGQGVGCFCAPQATAQRCQTLSHGSCPRIAQSKPSLHPSLKAVLKEAVPSVVPHQKKPSNDHSIEVEIDLQGFLNQLLSGHIKAAGPIAPKPAPKPAPVPRQTPSPSERDLQSFLNHLFSPHANETGPVAPKPAPALAPRRTTESSAPTHPLQSELDLQGFLNLVFSPYANEAGPTAPALTPAPQRTTESSAPKQVVQPETDLQSILNQLFSPPTKEAGLTAPTPARAAAPTPERTTESNASEHPLQSTLKSLLVDRLNNEEASEVIDTIHAIFASLQPAESAPAPSSPSSSATPSGSGKGKAKAVDTSSATVTSPTSKDVLNAMQEIHSLEAAYVALADEFTFPSQLDFIAAHVTSGSPASSDSEASATTHLAYTSRNHPVRFYEQALNELLTQLDAVDSFTNEDLRGTRREVVEKVNGALEELEREVEGRWKARLSKDSKTFKVEVIDPVSLAAEPLAETDSTSNGSENTSTDNTLGASDSSDSTISQGEDLPSASETKSETPDTPEQAAIATPSTSTNTEALAVSLINGSVDVEEPVPVPELKETPVTSDSNPLLSPSPSLAASAATITPYDASPVEVDAVDTFLLPASDADLPQKPSFRESETDTGSDWSEVEA